MVSLFLVGCGENDGRFEVKNVKLPVRTTIAANTVNAGGSRIEYQEELIKVDTKTGKVWKLQHGSSQIGGSISEFSLWDELGNTYRENGKDVRKPQ